MFTLCTTVFFHLLVVMALLNSLKTQGLLFWPLFRSYSQKMSFSTMVHHVFLPDLFTFLPLSLTTVFHSSSFPPNFLRCWPFLCPPPLRCLSSLTETETLCSSINPLPRRILLWPCPPFPNSHWTGYIFHQFGSMHLSKAGFRRLNAQKISQNFFLLLSPPQAQPPEL